MSNGLLEIGRRFALEVESIADAQAFYCRYRDDSGEGMRTWPDGLLAIDGRCYRLSYNGRVWSNGQPLDGGSVSAASRLIR